MKESGVIQFGAAGTFDLNMDKPRMTSISENFQKALGAALMVGRVFGVFPHLNITDGWRSKDLVLSFRQMSQLDNLHIVDPFN